MPTLPTGTVTFLFTDIAGSTALWERDRDAMKAALAQHDAHTIARTVYRFPENPTSRNANLGFRLVVSSPIAP